MVARLTADGLSRRCDVRESRGPMYCMPVGCSAPSQTEHAIPKSKLGRLEAMRREGRVTNFGGWRGSGRQLHRLRRRHQYVRRRAAPRKIAARAMLIAGC